MKLTLTGETEAPSLPDFGVLGVTAVREGFAEIFDLSLKKRQKLCPFPL